MNMTELRTNLTETLSSKDEANAAWQVVENTVTQELAAVEAQRVADVAAKAKEITDAKDAEIATLKTEHADEVATLKSKHDAALADAKATADAALAKAQSDAAAAAAKATADAATAKEAADAALAAAVLAEGKAVQARLDDLVAAGQAAHAAGDLVALGTVLEQAYAYTATARREKLEAEVAAANAAADALAAKLAAL